MVWYTYGKMASATESASKETITVGGQSRRMPRLPKLPRFTSRRALITLGILIIAIAIIVIGLLLVKNYNDRRHKTSTHAGSQDLTSQVNAALAQRDYFKALNLVNAQKNPTTKTKLLKATVLTEGGKYSDALKLYQSLMKATDLATYTSVPNFYSNAGAVAAQAGQKQLAITYYQQAINLFNSHPPKGPTSNDVVITSQQAIKELQK